MSRPLWMNPFVIAKLGRLCPDLAGLASSDEQEILGAMFDAYERLTGRYGRQIDVGGYAGFYGRRMRAWPGGPDAGAFFGAMGGVAHHALWASGERVRL